MEGGPGEHGLGTCQEYPERHSCPSQTRNSFPVKLAKGRQFEAHYTIRKQYITTTHTKAHMYTLSCSYYTMLLQKNDCEKIFCAFPPKTVSLCDFYSCVLEFLVLLLLHVIKYLQYNFLHPLPHIICLKKACMFNSPFRLSARNFDCFT